MKILQIINALTLGGAQFVVLDLARRARCEGHDVEIACFRDGPLGEILRQEGFVVHILGEKMLDLPAFVRLMALMRTFRPEIVHSHLFRASFWARILCLLYPEVKLVTSVHGYETRTFHRLEKLMSRLSDFIIFPSRYLRDWYRGNIRALKAEECRVIYPGVNIRPIKEPQVKESLIKIGTLSRLHPVKGIDRLLHACALLKTRSVKFVLLIGGEGRQRTELQALAAKLEIADECRFVGQVSDQREFLDQLDIFVAASRQEAFGIHVCEAMERALPIVGAGVGGIPELVENQKTGLLFAAEDVTALADSLEKLVADKEFRLQAGKLGRERVEASFNRQIGIEKHLEIFSLLTQRPGHVHFAVSSSELGGGERLALGLMKSLVGRGWRVSATCAGTPLSTEIEALGIECSVASVGVEGIFYLTKLLRDILCLRPMVVSSHLNRSSLFAGILGRIARLPVVSHVHGLNQKVYYQLSNRQIAVSDAVGNHLLAQGMNPAGLVIIKNCIQAAAVGPRPAPTGALQVAITAKLHANKGHSWALEAISRQPDLCGIGSIHILGDGPERQNLEKQCSVGPLKDLVVFHGFVAEPD
ncbi:MAG: glycosyltransferase, partial [Candidatus Riflebacteria bacterium]|nr:glycosyltransferase [Candidatus Riflebacteria bacterium]